MKSNRNKMSQQRRKTIAINPDTNELDSAKWFPKQDETYYSLVVKGACGFFVTEAKWNGNAVDIDRLENGNCFQTKEEANHWCTKFKLIR